MSTISEDEAVGRAREWRFLGRRRRPAVEHRARRPPQGRWQRVRWTGVPGSLDELCRALW